MLKLQCKDVEYMILWRYLLGTYLRYFTWQKKKKKKKKFKTVPC
jgi:hypothetical protein